MRWSTPTINRNRIIDKDIDPLLKYVGAKNSLWEASQAKLQVMLTVPY
jgi:hypothetical protein